MNLQDLYGATLLVVLIGMVIGVGVLTLDKFASTSGVTVAAQTAINASRDAVGDIATDWMPLIVTVVVLALILGLIVGAFVYKNR